MVAEIEDPFERFLAFIVERETIRTKRGNGEPPPWTDDIILQSYRFTNINRENDKVSRHYQKTIRSLYRETYPILPATMLYRWFNRPETCTHFFDQPDMLNGKTVFESYLDNENLSTLLRCLARIPPPHITGAYIIIGQPGYPKGEGVLRYFDKWYHKKPWKKIWKEWLDNPPISLQQLFDAIQSDGLGDFMTAQIVADLKYLHPFRHYSTDWFTWAVPGPGSLRGLNLVLGRPLNLRWDKKIWFEELGRLQTDVNIELPRYNIAQLHAQDLQNTLCEFSKYEKTRLGLGRPRQKYYV